MVMDQQNSLEDWFAVKDDIFQNQSCSNITQKLRFFVAYNSSEGIFAITCSKGHRKASDIESKSLACSLSISELKTIHTDLKLVHPTLENYFPQLPDQSSGIIHHMLSVLRPSTCDIDDDTCRLVEFYLEKAVALCGEKLLLSVLFDKDPLSYFEEDIQEFRQKGFDNVLKSQFEELKQIITKWKNSETMIEKADCYKLEDEIISDIIITISDMYIFQRQPFLQSREISYNRMQLAKSQIEDPDLGDRIKQDAQRGITLYTDQYWSAEGALQHLYMEYYRRSIDLIEGQLKRLRHDKKKFGRSSFEICGGNTRLQMIEISYVSEKLKLLNAIKAAKEYQIERLTKGVDHKNLDNQDKKALDSQVEEIELSILESKLEILNEEESLLKLKILALEKEDSTSEDYFFDAVEDIECINDSDQNTSQSNNAEVEKLRKKLRSLFTKRAAYRNKRKRLISNKDDEKKIQQTIKSNNEKHHILHIKRQIKMLEDKKREDNFKECRLKTLKRLRKFRRQNNEKINHEVSDEEESSIFDLPPYPELNLISYDIPYPPPPPLPSSDNGEGSADILTNRMPTLNSNMNFSSPSSDPCHSPLPPSPPSIQAPVPPPPPPPPPPPSFLSINGSQKPLSSMLQSIELKSNGTFEKPKLQDSIGPNIDLSELLKAKDKLKKVDLSSCLTKNEKECPMQAALRRIRESMHVGDSDGSESDESDSFSQNLSD